MRVRPRSIANLTGAVLAAAVGLAAFRNPTEELLIILLLLRFFILIYATLQTRVAGSADRAWWFGFAVFGWAYAGFVVAAFSDQGRSWSAAWFEPGNILGNLASITMAPTPSRPAWRLAAVARFWLTLGFGSLGGYLAHWLVRRSEFADRDADATELARTHRVQ